MSLGKISVEQPVLAIVLSIVTVIIGILAYFTLPVSEYPDIVPPTIVVGTTYPGASAQTIAQTIATPIEQEVNGVEDMLYMYSQATSDGGLTLTVTFKPGTDLDKAQVQVQNRVALAIPRLPEPVQRNGVSVRKSSPTQFLTLFMFSPDNTYDQQYVSNYLLRRVSDIIKRIDGVGDIQYFGVREYAMRVWLDPARAAAMNLMPGEILAAIRSQSTQVAGGTIAESPVSGQAFQRNLIFEGRLKTPEDFDNIIIKTGSDGRIVRLKDIARIEIGAMAYSTDSYLAGRPAVSMQVRQQPGANALEATKKIEDTMVALKKDFPKGLDYKIAYNPTEFIADSISELVKTIYEAVILVVVVILVFLQGWRPSIIPILAIPVSLIGTLAAMKGLGFSLNNLTLFGLVLSVGIVVDNAIVVVENVERHLANGETAREATLRTMREVSGALFAITLVLCAVFVPTAFISGISGQFFRQFGITVAIATAISCFNSLTLSPALAAIILRGHVQTGGLAGHKTRGGVMGMVTRAGASFNRGFDRMSTSYGTLARRLISVTPAMMVVYALLIGATAYLLVSTPKGFIPAMDRGYLIIMPQLPDGASLERTTTLARQMEKIAVATPGVERVPIFSGYSGATNSISSSNAALFVILKPFPERIKAKLTAEHIADDLRKRLGGITGANILVVPPPPVEGIGSTGGFAMRLQDRGGLGTEALAKATNDLVAAANKTPGMVGVYTTFSASTPQVKVELDREKAEMLGVPAQNVNDVIETYFGSSYVNDFNMLGHTYRVTAQADLPYRATAADLGMLKARNSEGNMVPVASVTRLKDTLGTERVPRYNLYPASEISGDTIPGKGAEFAIATMARLAQETLPPGIAFEWTDLSYQQTTAGNTTLLIFPLCVLFVYLVLAAQYGSWSLPLSILLIVPMCLLAATTGLRIMGQEMNILTQIGFVVLLGLAAKNAILIVEFAVQLEQEGKERIDAVVEACRLRLRPILMTSLAFILGVLPLVTTPGAGSEMRKSVGITVFFGMIGVTVFGLLFTPVFYALVRRMAGASSPASSAAEPVAVASA